jgi:hypothetical protein
LAAAEMLRREFEGELTMVSSDAGLGLVTAEPYAAPTSLVLESSGAAP